MKMRLSLTAVVLLLTTQLFAQGIIFSIGDFDFEVYGKDSTEVQLKAFDDILKGDIVIPESVSYKGKTYAVTRIEDWGNNPKVVSIRIPKTVRTISSLSSLSNLQNVYVDEGNPTYLSIDGVLISSSDMSLNEYPQGRAGECVVPEGVKRINTNFRSGITKLTIPSSVTYITSSIGYYIKAFDVAEGNALFSSYNGMLCSKDGKTLITYPATSSSMVVIPENIDSIGTYAFQQSKSIIISKALPLSIGHSVWYDYNTSITGIYVKSEHLTTYQSNAKTSKYNLYGYDIIADSILYAKTDEGKSALIGSYSQSPSISIPQTITDGTNTYTITSIGRKAFYQNSALQEVIFPETLEAIGDSAFYYTNLREITLPATLTKLGKYAFYCRNLNIIYAKCAPVDIREGCFYSYYSTYLYVPYEYEELYKTAMGWGNFTITANDLVYDNFVFKKVTDETLMVIKYIGNQTDITMPDEVAIDNKMYKITAIGESVFYSKKLTNIKLPKYLEVIRERAFRNNSLTSIEFPASLKTIGDYAFYSNSLQTINLPASLESIGYYAFSSNSNLRTIIVNGEVPCELEYNAFGYSSNIMIMVKPSSAAEAYKTDLDWSNYSSYIYGADAIIDELAYLKHDNQTVTLVSCLKAFSDNEYEKMTIPKSVNIDNADYQVTTIGEGAFYSVNNLNELIIPETIDSIGSRAFDSNLIIRCESLK